MQPTVEISESTGSPGSTGTHSTPDTTSDKAPASGIARIGRLPRTPVLWLIRLYQRTISLALPPDTCRFYPSCSHYGYEAIDKYGLIKGGAMATWRVMRCNPWNKGGLDPVP